MNIILYLKKSSQNSEVSSDLHTTTQNNSKNKIKCLTTDIIIIIANTSVCT